jgi:hypothetical protein
VRRRAAAGGRRHRRRLAGFRPNDPLARNARADRAQRYALILRLVMLWLAALGLRSTLLAVPPVLPLIHRDLRLSETAVAALATCRC